MLNLGSMQYLRYTRADKIITFSVFRNVAKSVSHCYQETWQNEIEVQLMNLLKVVIPGQTSARRNF